MTKKITGVIIILILITIFGIYHYTKSPITKKRDIEESKSEEIVAMSNIIEDVEYSSKDASGNEYIIKAEEGETDIKNTNIIFLKNVSAIIKLKNSNEILIFADFGKYNIDNFDTIFSKNVIINYLEKKITSDYMDFSIERNSMIMSKNVVYSNINNILKSDVIEINLDTKDTKIFMFENDKKVNIKSKNWYGYNKKI